LFAPPAPASVIPRSWLLVGIVVLASVHLSWALDGSANTDVAAGSYPAEGSNQASAFPTS